MMRSAESAQPTTQEDMTAYDWMNPLLTDMYQLTMCYAEWKAGRHETPSVFEAYFRKNPFKGKYTIFAGMDEVLRYLRDYKFNESHISYISSVMPHLDPGFLDWLRKLDCSTIRVTGFTDGQVCFPSEPLLSLEGPFALLQLLETPLLNMINFSSLVCTNASRFKLTAGPNVSCVEFGLRRAQGPNGASVASKYSYLGGFFGTSNCYAGYLTGIPVLGTCAHSYVMSFEKESDIATSRKLDGVDILEKALEYRTQLGWTDTVLAELYAFVSFAVAYPDAFGSLVDSYSTMKSGVKNFLLCALVLDDLGHKA